MLDLLDLWLFCRSTPSDDRSLSFRRIDGCPTSKVVYFLPWHTPFSIAKQLGLVPLDFLACYEMPPAIVSSVPELSVDAMHALVGDAQTLLARNGLQGSDVLIVGLSVGTYPATYLANMVGARLCAVAPSDRADLMIWESPAARLIKRYALKRGICLSHYSRAMRGCHPVENLARISADSVFVMGVRDPLIPERRRTALLKAVQKFAPRARIFSLNAGHVKTMVWSARHQWAMAGIDPVRGWRLRLPIKVLLAQLSLPWSRVGLPPPKEDAPPMRSDVPRRRGWAGSLHGRELLSFSRIAPPLAQSSPRAPEAQGAAASPPVQPKTSGAVPVR